MHVALDGRCIHDHFPGIGRYAYNLFSCLADLAPDDHFTVLFAPSANNSRHDMPALGARGNVDLLPLESGVFSLGQQWAVPRALRSLRVDVHHSPYYLGPYLVGCPLVVTIHDMIPYLLPRALPRPRLALAFRVLAGIAGRRSTRVITASSSARDDVIRVLGLPPHKVTAVPLACDSTFRPQSPGECRRVAERLGLATPYVLYLGMNKPHKNLLRLVEAWQRIPSDSLGSTALVLAGRWDPRYTEVQARVQALGLEQRVKIVGPVDPADLAGLYSGSSAFVFPSLYEGFGLPMLEAMACGTPVACSRSASLPEVVGDAAVLFDAEDVDAIAAAIVRVLDTSVGRALRSQGLARAATYSWRRTAQETLAIYRQAASGG